MGNAKRDGHRRLWGIPTARFKARGCLSAMAFSVAMALRKRTLFVSSWICGIRPNTCLSSRHRVFLRATIATDNQWVDTCECGASYSEWFTLHGANSMQLQLPEGELSHRCGVVATAPFQPLEVIAS